MKSNIRKPNIERWKTAIKGGIPDRVPNFEICIEERNVEYILGRKAGSTMAASRGADDNTLHLPPMKPQDYIEICNFTGQDAIGLEACWVPFKYKDHKGDLHLIDDGRIKSFEELEKVEKPCWELDYKPKREYLEQYKKAINGTGLGLYYAPGCLFQGCYQFLVGFDDFFVLVYTETEFIEVLLDMCMEYYLKITEIALDVGIDVLYLGDDIAFKAGPFVNPEIYKKLWLPRIKKLADLGKQADLPIVFHSCGNVTNLIDDILLPVGIDCLNPIEPYSMDIFEIKKKYAGKLSIAGNIDIAGPLATGTPEQVKVIVRNHLEKLMPGGGYIMQSSHSITDDIPPENYMAMLETVYEYGVY